MFWVVEHRSCKQIKMFKRVEINRENENPIPAKRPKYDVKRDSLVGTSTRNNELRNKKSGKSDDVWGDDFAEEDIEEIDFVATQACLQVPFILRILHLGLCILLIIHDYFIFRMMVSRANQRQIRNHLLVKRFLI